MILKLITFLIISLMGVSCGSNYEDTSGLITNAQQQLGLNSITLDTPANINAANANSYGLSGTCSPEGSSINLDVNGQTQSASCSAGIWSISGWDLSSVADSTSVTVGVDLLDDQAAVVLSASGSVIKDVIAPSVTLNPAADVTPVNVTTYSVDGTCDEEGGTITVFLGSLSSSSTCSSNLWTISNWDVSAEPDALNIAVTADISDTAGNAATQANDSVYKDSTAPAVEITSPADASYINIASDSATFSVNGTCNKNGETVDIKIDGVSAASQVGFVCDGTNFNGTIDTTGIGQAAIVMTAQMVYNAQTATSSNINLVKDTVAPIISLDALSNITSANVSSYSLSGTCDSEGSTVSVNLGGLSNSSLCSSGTFSISSWDVSAESDATGIVVTADLNDAAGNAAIQATGSVDKDSTAPNVEIASPADSSFINISSDSATFVVSGTCNKNGETVVVNIDGVSAASQVGFVCDGTNFNGTIDTTGVADAAIVITAELTKDAVTGTSSNINITKDTTAPTVAIDSPATVNIANASSYSLSGTCDEDGNVSIDIGGVTASGSCTSGLWTISSVDVTSATDNANVSITADMNDLAGNPATQASSSVLKDTVAPTIAISSAADINGSNQTSYSIIGTCSEEGQIVTVAIGGLSYTPSCSGGSFTTGSVDVSSLLDATGISITADISDTAGNPATQATDAVDKNVSVPTVTIDVAPEISQANVTGYVTSGTCSENGQTVILNIGSINVNPNCSSGTWSSGFVDVSSLTDGSITITADHSNTDPTPAIQASVSVNKDTAGPTVTISSAPSITSANETNYIASGTCSESGRTVDVYIDSLNFTPTCSGSKTWTTGFVDVSSIPDGSGISVTADHDNASAQQATQATASINKSTSTPTIAGLSVSATLTESADISWNLNDPGGFTIDDYVVNYRVKGTSTWLNFNDGVSTNTNSSVTSLTASTTYEFRAAVKYDSTEQSPWSNTAEGETQPDSPVFGANKAMNVGGATTSTVVAYQDNTQVTLNGSALTTLNKGQSHTFVSTQFDVIDADKPIYTSGRRGSGGDTSKGNIVWQPTSWAGKAFSFNTIRYNPQILEVYAIESAYVEIRQGSNVVASATISAENGSSLTWSVYGSFQVVSTGSILAFHYSNSSGRYVDPKPVLPSANEIIGIPSRSMRITADLDGTNYNGLHGDSTPISGSLGKTNVINVNGRGTASYYREHGLLISADKKISGAAFADSNGGCATPFLPTNLMRKKYVIPVQATYVAFTSKQAGTIQVLDQSDNVIQTLTLVRSGGATNAPYTARRGVTNAGYRFVATVPVYAVYEPSTDTGASDNDETIMYGTDE